MSITCTFVSYHDDMYPEFAPEPIVVRCEADATARVYGADEQGYAFHVICCGPHAAEFADDDRATEVALSTFFAEGYAYGVVRATAAGLDSRTATIINHEGVDAVMPKPLATDVPPWDDSVSDTEGDEWEEGYQYGWETTLGSRAAALEGI